ncbi:MAG TPA: hypothetical protein VJ010_01410, partial [Actinomycetota bacterium]|nr:hypothetical protein [Actinomycetota bacterium]
MERRKWDVLGTLASIAVVLVAYSGVAFGGRTFDTSAEVPGVNGNLPPTGVAAFRGPDLIRPDKGAGAWQTTPWAQVTHQQITRGRWPLWNPYQGIGQPLAANMQSAALDPLFLAIDLHPTTRTWDLTYLFVFVLGSVMTYAFCRRLGIGVLGAVAGASAFSLFGYFAMDTADAFVHVYVYLPILFLTVDGVARTGKLRWVAATGAAVAGCILAGMPESTFFVLVAAGAYAVFRVLTADSGQRWSAALRLFSAALLGLALAAPLLLLFVQYLGVAYSLHTPGHGARTGPLAALLSWITPFVRGETMSGGWAGVGIDRGWIGMAWATLLAVAAAAPRSTLRRSGGWFFIALGLVVLARNHSVPIVGLLGRLPGFDRADSFAFAPPVAGFALAVAAAIGIDALGSGDIRRRRLVIGVVVVASVSAVLVAEGGGGSPVPHVALDRRWVLVGGVAAAFVIFAALVAVRSPDSPGARRLAAGLATATLVAELLVLFPSSSIYAPRSDPFRPPPWLDFLQPALAQDPSGRVFGFDAVLYPDTAGVFGLSDVRTVDALFLKRYVTYLRSFVFPFVDRFTGDGLPDDTAQGNPMFDLLGVRYVLSSTKELDHGAGAGQYRFLGSSGGVKVYENSHGLPRAFVAQDVHRAGDMAGAVSYLQSLGSAWPDGTTRVDRFDPARQAVVEVAHGGSLPSPAGSGTQGPDRATRIASYDSQRVQVDVSAGSAGLLVLTDAYYPGWQATVNGRPAPILATDVAFRG